MMVTAVAVLAGLAGMVAVWFTPPEWGGLGALFVAFVGAVGLNLLALPVLWMDGLDLFGLLHLAYLGVVITVPVIGVTLGFRALLRVKRQLAPEWSVVAVVMLLPIAVGWYGTHVAPYQLEVEREELALPPERAGSDTIRVGVLSDLQTDHVTSYEHRAVDRLMAQEPDIILMPGDLFQGKPDAFAREEEALRELVGQLHAPHGVYFVHGDTDSWEYPERAFEGSEVVIVEDELIEIEIGDRMVRLVGNPLNYESEAAREARELLTDASDDDGDAVNILLAHRPDVVLELPESSRVDLVVSGHTHGGQIVVPGLGPPVTLSSLPREVGAGGLHQVNGNWIYVSSGVGLERGQAPQVRLFSRPSIGILELH